VAPAQQTSKLYFFTQILFIKHPYRIFWPSNPHTDEKDEAFGRAIALSVLTLDSAPRRRIQNRRQISLRFVVD
jgi:hypothetical protein